MLRELDISDYYGSTYRSIPASWANMTGPLTLRALRAKLSGPVDGLLSGGRMPNLKTLVVGDNRELYGTLPTGGQRYAASSNFLKPPWCNHKQTPSSQNLW